MSRKLTVALAGLAVAGLLGCGSSPGCGGSCQNAGGGALSTHASSTAGRGTPRPAGCDALCQDAGPAAGNGGPGAYHCPSGGCLPCPAQGCLGIISHSAVMNGAAASVLVRCEVKQTCDGALVLWRSGSLAARDRLGGSDIRIAPGRTTSVAIATTPLGAQLAAAPSGVAAAVIVVLRGYGYDTTSATLRLHR